MGDSTKAELIKGAISNSDTNVTWLFTLNGAAGAGLMTFIGNTIDKQHKFYNWHLFGISLTLFGAGILMALICSLFKMFGLILAPQVKVADEKMDDTLLNITLLRATKYFLWSFLFYSLSILCLISGIFVGVQAIFGLFVRCNL